MPEDQKKQASPTDQRAVLRFLTGKHAQEVIKLRPGTTILGREKGDIFVADTEVSATHCQLVCIQNEYFILDMNSTNGTYVNANRIKRVKLNSGDKITVGRTDILFTLSSADEVQDISTNFHMTAKERAPAEERTAIVDTLIKKEKTQAAPWNIVISAQYPSGLREEYAINQNQVYLGRATTFGHFEDDEAISRRHVLLKVSASGEIHIEDLGSTNGTYLNDKLIQGVQEVQAKDLVRIGACLLTIQARKRSP